MKYFLAFYIAGWLFCLLRLYYPSIRFLQKFDSSNILVRQKVLGWLVASLGFFIATQKLIPKFKMLHIEELGHNTLLFPFIERKSIRPSYKTPCAYYLYNYSNRQLKKEKVCILN